MPLNQHPPLTQTPPPETSNTFQTTPDHPTPPDRNRSSAYPAGADAPHEKSRTAPTACIRAGGPFSPGRRRRKGWPGNHGKANSPASCKAAVHTFQPARPGPRPAAATRAAT